MSSLLGWKRSNVTNVPSGGGWPVKGRHVQASGWCFGSDRSGFGLGPCSQICKARAGAPSGHRGCSCCALSVPDQGGPHQRLADVNWPILCLIAHLCLFCDKCCLVGAGMDSELFRLPRSWICPPVCPTDPFVPSLLATFP